MARKRILTEDFGEPPPIEFPKSYVVLVMEREADLPVFVRFRPDGEIETLSVLEEPPEAFFYEEGDPLLTVAKKLEKLFPNVLLHPFRRPLDRETLDFMHYVAYENFGSRRLVAGAAGSPDASLMQLVVCERLKCFRSMGATVPSMFEPSGATVVSIDGPRIAALAQFLL